MGSRFASDAYAIDCGIIIIAMVVPAIMSLVTYSFFDSASGNHEVKLSARDLI